MTELPDSSFSKSADPAASPSSTRFTPLRVAVMYLSFGLLWIVGTDRAFVWLGIEGEQGFLPSVAKGSFFVLMSAALVYWLVRNELVRVVRAHTLLTAVTEGTTDAVFVKDREGKYLFVNDVVARIAGKPAVEILGHDDHILFDAASVRVIQDRDRRIMLEGCAETQEEVLTAEGTTRTYLATKAPFRDSNGKVIGIIGISRDVSEWVEAKESLRQQEVFARGVLDAMTSQIAVLDANGVIVAVNEAWRSFAAEVAEGTDFSPRSGIGVNYLDVCAIDPTTQAGEMRAAEGIRQVIQGRIPRFSLEYPCHSPQTQRWFLMNVTRLDSLNYVVVSHLEITERIRSEENWRASERRFRELADAIPQIVWTAGPDGGLTTYNAQAEEYSGLSQHALTGWSWERVIHPDDLPSMVKKWTAILQSGVPHDIEARIRRADGEYRWHICRQVPARDATGVIERWYGTCTDIEDLKRVELKVRDRERMLGIVTGSARVGLGVVDENYEYLFVNEAFAQQLGQSLETMIGCKVADVLPDSWEFLQPRIDRALQNERVTYERPLPHLGSAMGPRWIWAVFEPHTDDAGRRTIVAVSMDITDRKQTEIAIRDSEERYRSLMDMLPEAVLIHRHNRIVYCNAAGLDAFGATSLDQLTDQSPIDRLHPECHAGLRERIAVMLATRKPTPGVRQTMLRLDGTAFPAHLLATPISDQGSDAILVCFQDLTESERTIEVLQSVLASVDDAILTIDEHGTIESVNAATERIFGYPVASVVGQQINLLIPASFRTGQDSYHLAREIGTRREVEGLRQNGTSFPVEFTVTELQLEGKPHYTVVFRDLTAQRRLEAQFQQAQKMEAVGRLAGGVAHDFNNLLTVIIGYTDIILRDLAATDRLRPLIAAIHDAGDKATRLTSQLLAFSRKAMIEPKLLDLNRLIKDSLELLRRLMGEDIEIDLHLDPSLATIKADPGQLEQLLMNLAVNARDAMPNGGRLTIATANVAADALRTVGDPPLSQGHRVRLTVADTGQGMTDEVKTRIFEPFFTTKDVGKGTGLGLSVVHGVIQQCSGHVHVDSQVGVGTRFEIDFPVTMEADLRTKIDSDPSLEATGTGTVLLVEDEPDVRAIARLGLTMQGYEVLEASSGAQALAQAAGYAGVIDLLVTDVVMPAMSGRSLAEELRKSRPELHVLYMSGYTDDEILRHGVVQAQDVFLQKPFTVPGLVRKVREAIDDGV